MDLFNWTGPFWLNNNVSSVASVCLQYKPKNNHPIDMSFHLDILRYPNVVYNNRTMAKLP